MPADLELAAPSRQIHVHGRVARAVVRSVVPVPAVKGVRAVAADQGIVARAA